MARRADIGGTTHAAAAANAAVSHHLDDEILLAYAAGALSEAESLFVAVHATLCAECRVKIEDFEAVGGAALDLVEPEPISLDSLDAIMARIDDGDDEADAGSSLSAVSWDGDRKAAPAAGRGLRSRGRSTPMVMDGQPVPRPLAAYLPDTVSLPWRQVMRGLDEVDLSVGGAKTKLLRIKAGAAMPQHTHHGTEMTLVLAGGFSDERGHFIRGDIAITDDTVDHRPVADDDGDCICLTLTNAPLRLTGPIGRFLNPFVRF